MPLILNYTNTVDQIALWKIDENEFTDLQPSINDRNYLTEKQYQRSRQRKACLELVTIFAGNDKTVYYDDHGKPHLANDRRKLSFSHSGEYAAMMLSDDYAGIDFELIRPKVLNISHKFLNHAELDSLHPQNGIEHAHVYWGAKESLYKVHGKQQLIFKDQILIEPFSYEAPGGYFFARLETQDLTRKFKLFYEKMFGYMLVYVVNDSNQ